MPPSRLYATLVAMGASLTGATGIAVVAATVPACSSHGHFALIDMSYALIDASYSFIDMSYALIDIAVVPDLADGATPADMGDDLREQD